MRCTAILALFAASAFGQNTADLFNRAPKEIDDALRARINQFYEFHVKAKFREAEALVADDTKDFFYDRNKPQYEGFEIMRIEYSDGYTRAKATVGVEQRIMMPGFEGKIMKIPAPSYWKLVKNANDKEPQWYWYVDQEILSDSPFGKMKGGPDTSKGTLQLPPMPGDMAQLMAMVSPEKSEAIVKAGESDHIQIPNKMQGPITLTLQGKIEGIEAALDTTTVEPGKSATLTVKAGSGAKNGTLTIMVSPLGKAIPIQVTVK